MTVDEIVGLTWDGLKRFDGKTAVYIRPMYWAEHGGYMGVPAEPSSTRFCLCLYESPMIASDRLLDHRVAVPAADDGDDADQRQGRLPLSQQRPGDPRGQDARLRQCAGARHAGQCRRDRRRSNIFLVHDGQVVTPAANGTFLSGITRARTIALLAEQGIEVAERTVSVREFLEADEMFSTGNHSKVVPVIRVEDRHLQPGPVAKKARELYWDFAHSTPTG